MNLAPLVPAEPDESVSARVAAIVTLSIPHYEPTRTSRDFDAMNDDVPTKVEVPR